MPSTTSYKRGTVVLVPFPFTDLSGAKQRPAMVVSPDTLNTTRPDVLLVAITSQVPAVLAPDEIAIASADLAAAGLPKPSIVRISKLIAIHQGLIRKSIGQMPDLTFHRVLTQLQTLFQP